LTAKNGDSDSVTGACLIASDDKRHGYLTLTVTADAISGTMTAMTKGSGNPVPDIDKFEYPAALQTLPANVTVSL
jgi:hypothetical protein